MLYPIMGNNIRDPILWKGNPSNFHHFGFMHFAVDVHVVEFRRTSFHRQITDHGMSIGVIE